jgi:hypothetical protein
MAGICARSRRSLGGGQATTDRTVLVRCSNCGGPFHPFNDSQIRRGRLNLLDYLGMGRPIVLSLRHVDMTRPAWLLDSLVSPPRQCRVGVTSE